MLHLIGEDFLFGNSGNSEMQPTRATRAIWSLDHLKNTCYALKENFGCSHDGLFSAVVNSVQVR